MRRSLDMMMMMVMVMMKMMMMMMMMMTMMMMMMMIMIMIMIMMMHWLCSSYRLLSWESWTTEAFHEIPWPYPHGGRKTCDNAQASSWFWHEVRKYRLGDMFSWTGCLTTQVKTCRSTMLGAAAYPMFVLDAFQLNCLDWCWIPFHMFWQVCRRSL